MNPYFETVFALVESDDQSQFVETDPQISFVISQITVFWSVKAG
jgi:hypothetical protein